MRVVFMGTPDFAVEILEEIIKAGHEVVLAVTQPDKPKGRGKAVQFSPVKECAFSHGIEVFQPKRVKEPENISYLSKYDPDVIIVAAFGQILPRAVLELPPNGCLNVHASLLPKYRGSSPIQWAIINGDEITGVTIQRMDIGIDTGDMIAKREIRLDPEETGGSLFDKLAELGAKLCVETMEMIEKGTAEYTPQNNDEATHTAMIGKELGDIDWNRSAAAIERLIRGLNPWPSAYTHLNGKTLKIWKAKVISGESGYEPGCIVKAAKDEIQVQTGDGILSLLEVQLEGKKRMETSAFLRGYHLEEGSFFQRL